MKLSIIIVSWNVKDDLAVCLRSIYENRPHEQFEVIVVDNASKDGTVETLKSDFPQVRIIANDDNRGFSGANNQGIEIAEGEYLFLLNPDTIVHRNSLDNLIKIFDENPRVGACGPKILTGEGEIQASVGGLPTFRATLYRYTFLRPLGIFRKHYKGLSVEKSEYDKQMNVELLSGAAIMVRRSVIEQVGPMDEAFFMYAEEGDLCLRIRKGGWTLLYVPESVITHLQGRSAARLSSANRQYILYSSLLLYFRKHRGGLTTRLFALIFKPAVIIRNIVNVFSCTVKYLFYVLLSDKRRKSKALAKLENSLVFLGRYSWRFLFNA